MTLQPLFPMTWRFSPCGLALVLFAKLPPCPCRVPLNFSQLKYRGTTSRFKVRVPSALLPAFPGKSLSHLSQNVTRSPNSQELSSPPYFHGRFSISGVFLKLQPYRRSSPQLSFRRTLPPYILRSLYCSNDGSLKSFSSRSVTRVQDPEIPFIPVTGLLPIGFLSLPPSSSTSFSLE